MLCSRGSKPPIGTQSWAVESVLEGGPHIPTKVQKTILFVEPPGESLVCKYLLEVTRYVHLNPVRAALVCQPLEYRWSSYRIYLGLERDHLGLVEPRAILDLFGARPEEQTARYRQFVEELALKEQEMKRWLLRLERQRLIPPRRWLSQKVSDTSHAL